jgi:hypothetical protein
LIIFCKTTTNIKNQYITHSIAFKPAESGWGGGGKYANNFDAIFNKKKEKKETNNKDAGSTKKDEQ